MALLPEKFGDLERFVSRWTSPREGQRRDTRLGSTYEDLREFADAVEVQIKSILEYLAALPFEPLTEKDYALFCLAAAYMDAAMAIQFYGAVEIPVGFPAERFTIEAIPRFNVEGKPVAIT
jgi:hypothetical protein